MQLLGERPGTLGRLALEHPERGQLTLLLDDLLRHVHPHGPDQLVLEVRHADEEPEPLELLPGGG